MKAVRSVIVGGGLSGLYAAWLLERQGIGDYLLLEARTAFGGRILSASAGGTDTANAAPDRFDLGPTWFWPALQAELGQLVAELGLEPFAQHETGDMVVERSRHEAPFRMGGYATSPQSMRLAGGMATLVDALRQRLPPERLETGRLVRRLRCTGPQVELEVDDPQGRPLAYRADRVLLALPPRLAVATLEFTPALPDALRRAWDETPTWMAPHAKYVAVYDTPFWREQGLSGEGRSAVGPLAEIHDASAPDGRAALFGFLGVPAQIRKRVAGDELRALCRAQLARMFGPEAGRPIAELVKDWAADPLTATADDMESAAGHGIAPPATVASGPWRDRLTGIASEWSPGFPGYVAGAVEAARLGVGSLPPGNKTL